MNDQELKGRELKTRELGTVPKITLGISERLADTHRMITRIQEAANKITPVDIGKTEETQAEPHNLVEALEMIRQRADDANQKLAVIADTLESTL